MFTRRFPKILSMFLKSIRYHWIKFLSFNYLRSFLENKNDNLYKIAQKILDGFNENEVHITKKTQKLGFFEIF